MKIVPILNKNTIFTFFVLLTLCVNAFGANSNKKNTDKIKWKLVKANDQIHVYKAKDKETGLLRVKATLTVQSTLSGFLLFLQDTENIPHWLENATSAKIIKQISLNENIFITHFDGVWPVKARNMVITSQFRQNDDLSIDIFIKDASSSTPPIKDSIRVSALFGHWHIKPIKQNVNSQPTLLITHQFLIDPNGNIPKWIANKVTLSSIWVTLKNIHQQLPRSPLQNEQISGIKELRNAH